MSAIASDIAWCNVHTSRFPFKLSKFYVVIQRHPVAKPIATVDSENKACSVADAPEAHVHQGSDAGTDTASSNWEREFGVQATPLSSVPPSSTLRGKRIYNMPPPPA
jgi:hypothetical protein